MIDSMGCASIRVHLQMRVALILLVTTIFTRFSNALPKSNQIEPESFQGCSGNPADVVFMLDTSNSIWSRDFRQQMRFVKDIVKLFPIDSGIVRVGLLTYADTPSFHFRIGQYDRKSAILHAVEKIRHVGGYGTGTGNALRYMLELYFHKDPGKRANVTRVGIIVTDGLSDNKGQTRREAKRIKDEGIHLFVIGVGEGRNLEELHSIASHPTSYYTVLADNYQGLANIKDLLAIKTCSVTNPTKTTTVQTPMTSAIRTETRTQDPGTRGRQTLENADRRQSNDSRYGTSDATGREEDDGRREWKTSLRPGGKWERDSRLSNALEKQPEFWKLEKDGRFHRHLEAFEIGKEQLRPVVINNGSEVVEDGEELWSTGINGERVLVGKVFNGTKFIGNQISDYMERDLWWGYVIKEANESKETDIGSEDGGGALPLESGNGSQEVGGDGEGLQTGSQSSSTGEGFWLRHKAGRPVWYRYVRPGVYEALAQDIALEKLTEETSSDVDDKNDVTGKQTTSKDKSINGCHPRQPTDFVFAIDANSKDQQLVRDTWSLLRDIVSGINLNNSSRSKISFQVGSHQCSDSINLNDGDYVTKDVLLKAVDAMMEAAPWISGHLHVLETMLRSPDTADRSRRRVGVYLTDGKSENFTRSIEISDRAKHVDNVELFAVGLGSGVNPTELQTIASCPKGDHCFLLNGKINSQNIERISKKITRLLCSDQKNSISEMDDEEANCFTTTL